MAFTKDNQLVAVTGERMQMNDFIEVSAVITHLTVKRRTATLSSRKQLSLSHGNHKQNEAYH
jgi:hypothetical protein